jgi:hypothetical protein
MFSGPGETAAKGQSMVPRVSQNSSVRCSVVEDTKFREGKGMFRIGLMAAFLVCVGLGGVSYAQDAGTRARELAAALDKTKYKKKEKANISIEFYIDIKNEPALRANAAEYSGTYADDESRLDLRVAADGTVTGGGHDTSPERGQGGDFTLKDARVDGAFLSGTKIYTGGEARKFEAVFVNRTIANGQNAGKIDSRDTSFGIGWVENHSRVSGGSSEYWSNRVFLERK